MNWSGLTNPIRRLGGGGPGAFAHIIRRLVLVAPLSLALSGLSQSHRSLGPQTLASAVRPASVGIGNPVGDPVEHLPTRPKYLVLFVLDGARPDYFGLTHLPHVDRLRRQGAQYTRVIDGILESETPAGHATIATGSSPARNGILGFDWAQNDNDYSLFSPDVVRAGTMEHIMQAAGVPTIAGLYKAKYPKAQVVALSGHKYYAADPLGGPKADVIMYYEGDPHGRYVPVSIPGHSPPQSVLTAPGLASSTTHLGPGQDDHFATLLALSAFRRMHPRLLLINYPEFDWPLGHVYGGIVNRSRVVGLMQAFDRDLAMIEGAYSRAGVLQQTLFVITADHGMAPIHRFIPDTIVTNAVAAARTTAPALSFSTGGYIWLRDFSKAPAVADGIARAGARAGIQSVYYLSTVGGHMHYVRSAVSPLPAATDMTNRTLLGTLMNGHQPTVVAFADEGATFSSPSTHWKADHGGPTWQSQQIPLIFSGPGIKPGVVISQPAQLEDVAPTLLWDMGVTPSGMNGHVLSEAMLHPPDPGRVAARATEVRTLAGLVDAMIAEDRRER